MWPLSLMTENAQVALLATSCTAIFTFIGYILKSWLDRREFDRRKALEFEYRRRELEVEHEVYKLKKEFEKKLIREASIEEIETIKNETYGKIMGDLAPRGGLPPTYAWLSQSENVIVRFIIMPLASIYYSVKDFFHRNLTKLVFLLFVAIGIVLGFWFSIFFVR